MKKNKQKGEYDDCYVDLEQKLEFVKKLKNNQFPEIETLLELQLKIFKQNNYYYIIPQDIEELATQFKELLDTEKEFLDQQNKKGEKKWIKIKN